MGPCEPGPLPVSVDRERHHGRDRGDRRV